MRNAPVAAWTLKSFARNWKGRTDVDALVEKEAAAFEDAHGLDLRPFRNPELVENLAEVISAISFIKLATFLSMGLAVATFIAVQVVTPDDASKIGVFAFHLYCFVISFVAGIVTALAWVAHRVVGSIGGVLEVFFGVLKMVIGMALKEPPSGKSRPGLLALVRGISLVVFLPVLAEVLRDKLGLVGRVLFFSVRKVFMGPVLAVASRIMKKGQATGGSEDDSSDILGPPISTETEELPVSTEHGKGGGLAKQVDSFCDGVLSIQGKLGRSLLLPFRLAAIFLWVLVLFPIAWSMG
jgi:hypothetical protein